MNLTDCSIYEEVVALIQGNGWSSTQVASKCWHYHQNIALSKTDKTLRKRQEVYEWLCQYQQEFHIGNKPSKHKEFIVDQLKKGVKVNKLCQLCLDKGIVVAKSTIYKYKRELENG